MSGIAVGEYGSGLDAVSEKPEKILPGDARYGELSHSDNHRFEVTPDAFILPLNSYGVVSALREAIDDRSEVACRSGGHCGQDFVGSPRRNTILDLHRLNFVAAGAGNSGVRIGAGATVGEVQKELFRRWGAALPLGACSAVGMGGLVAGGGYGPLSRQLGLVADHLNAVEVAVVDSSRHVQLVTARASDDGELGDLFWAHTGGGGGNFGFATAYEFRSPKHLTGTDIELPRACTALNVQKVIYPWTMLNEDSFVSLVQQFFAWHEQHQVGGTPEASVFATFFLHHNSSPFLQLMVQSDADIDVDGSALAAFVDGLTAGTAINGISRGGRMTWLTGTRYMSQADCGDVMGARSASKSAYHRKALTDTQISVVYRHLTNQHPGTASYLMLNSYGGEINRRGSSETASTQRDSIVKSSWFTAWSDPADDYLQVDWLRDLYESVFASTGGVPIFGDTTAGCYINYPDIDMRDPARNRSGQPWHRLYYGENYARLQRTKRTWDPLNIFHHKMSIEP
ncbi:BBE domain-containing protein [Rhodococcus sp. H29-C3]|uniref:BBE domain-containing protein n=1 Tax=Rhodococcus sp. H29-C3 TaxID=3046307 RepID=UPI0024BB23BC|nr:BBE domain-containing protein [Rhodococcus sp. H29-C3]MDJ0362317.1 BBE domain-containing protein [Rhodococcus sp. H29-C3]